MWVDEETRYDYQLWTGDAKALSWQLSNTLHADFCVAAVDEATAEFGAPEIMNTDQGSQFTGHE